MQDRLQEILRRERLTPARFAELVGVQRSSVSHILSGRNKPSLEFLRKIMATLEHISPDWLISGNGPYKRTDKSYFNENNDKKSKSGPEDGTIKFPSLINSGKESGPENTSPLEKSINKEPASHPVNSETGPGKASSQPNSEKSASSGVGKKIVKTILFYDDQTFDVFYPA